MRRIVLDAGKLSDALDKLHYVKIDANTYYCNGTIVPTSIIDEIARAGLRSGRNEPIAKRALTIVEKTVACTFCGQPVGKKCTNIGSDRPYYSAHKLRKRKYYEATRTLR